MSKDSLSIGVRLLLVTLMVVSAQLTWGADDKTAAIDKPKADVTDAELREHAQAAMKKGLEWMKSLQRPDGSWSVSNYPAITALGLWAFTRSDHPDRVGVCSNAAAFIAEFTQEDGGIYRVGKGRAGGLSTYNTAICMTALHEYNRTKYAPAILAARKFMAGSQLSGDSVGAGGFGYDRNPPRPSSGAESSDRREQRADLSNTGWALQAMRVTQDTEDLRPKGESVADLNWSAVVKFVEKLQNQDQADEQNYGGFGYNPGAERGGTVVQKDGTLRLLGYGSMTYAGIESMIYARVDRNDPRVRSALHWAARHWSVDENPGMGTKGLFYYYNLMGKALSLTGSDVLSRPSGDPIPWKKQLLDKLIVSQRPDGSWINSDGTFWESDPVIVTAYVILAIEDILGK